MLSDQEFCWPERQAQASHLSCCILDLKAGRAQASPDTRLSSVAVWLWGGDTTTSLSVQLLPLPVWGLLGSSLQSGSWKWGGRCSWAQGKGLIRVWKRRCCFCRGAALLKVVKSERFLVTWWCRGPFGELAVLVVLVLRWVGAMVDRGACGTHTFAWVESSSFLRVLW